MEFRDSTGQLIKTKSTPIFTTPQAVTRKTRFEVVAETATDDELRKQIARSLSWLSIKGISEATRQWEENALSVAKAELEKRVEVASPEH